MQNLRRTLPPLSSLLPFEATARLGSITKAGYELGLTQAAISKQIRALEQNIGIQLFERRNRALFLTQDGRELQKVVAETLFTLSDFTQGLRHKSSDGEIVLHAQLCEGLYWLMPRLSQFYQKNPNIAVRVAVSTLPITQASERFDLALQTSNRDSGNAKCLHTTPDTVFPICSPKYQSNFSKPLSIKNIPQYRLLHHVTTPQDWTTWDEWFAKLGIDIRVQTKGEVYDSFPMMIQATIEGHGIALGWGHTAKQLIDDGLLIKPFNEQMLLPDGISVYRPSEFEMREDTSVLLDWIIDELS
ncbi:LysR family transcriptional regulator [Amylibacter sp. SFDW26]|uniref:LysR substrate-binding domain-containing protein n=1 Tax=Amylibacter sp. SFDW26 TaxID=2652722 RepID=UPI0012629529|nr:LysR substrate-binding domain-containing protein [Amylibacter sp. SFDW26]KAB7614656.1 LysR family transcriptional regulator [Amylibacter sp. SFDW26]